VSEPDDAESGIATDDLVAAVQDAEFFRSLVENGSDAIVSIDERSTILYANQSVERVFGYEPEELVGERLTKIMPERFRAEHFDAVERYLDTEERRLDWNRIQLAAEHRDGHEIPLSITFEEHSYEGRRVFSGIMRDVSERVEREETLERQNERLERFAGIVSHDLRDPLNAARATARLVEAGREEAAEDLFELFDQMDALIADVLALARQGQSVGDLEPVGLAEAAEDAWAAVGADDARLDVDRSLPTVAADPDRLRTVFQNLFRNAVEHGSASPRSRARGDAVEHGSTSTRPSADGVTVRVGRFSDADDLGFYVADDGRGFDGADVDRLFEYGYTTSEEGTGFGLNIVREIAEAHGWSVAATTGAAGGARFEIRGLAPAATE